MLEIGNARRQRVMRLVTLDGQGIVTSLEAGRLLVKLLDVDFVVDQQTAE